MNVNRRKLLGTSVKVGAGVALAGIFSGQAMATAEDVEKAIAMFAGDAKPTAGKITLTAPEIAENGNTVPIAISVDSPMTDDLYVESVTILAEGNPNPEVATFHFSPASGVAKASTRMRLAKTQNVVAIAKMSDGTFFSDTRNVKVTIGGCGG